MAEGNMYWVTAQSMEELLNVLKPLGNAIQMSAQQHTPVVFTKESLSNFGNALNHVEVEVKRQRGGYSLFR